jgi:hypothetical protein
MDVATACRARLEKLGAGAVISHITAARLHGIPLPAQLAHARVVHVCVPIGRRAPEGKRTVGHQTVLHAEDVTISRGVPCTSPARTFCDLSAMLTLPELVAAGDHLLRNKIVDLQDLVGAMARYSGRRGRANLRRSLDLLDGRSESPKESELRVLILLSGLPTPECNMTVLDGQHRFVARVDLAYPALRIAIEYEGDHHREKKQWRADLARRRRLEALGWIVLSVTQDDLTSPDAFLADVRSAMNRRLSAVGR